MESRSFTVKAPCRPQSGDRFGSSYPKQPFISSPTPESAIGQELSQLAEIGARAAALVHEMRNPLTTILMGLTSLQKTEQPEPVETRLSLALEEAERLQRLIDEISLYAKPLVVQRHELELNSLSQEMLASLTLPESLERKINFIGTSCAVWIKGDRDKLKQVFINLLTNACEAISSREVVTLTLNPQPANNLVWVRLHNGGRPIRPEVLAQLTQPFFTTKSNGNGLGLAIVKHIVEAHGGQLVIKSSGAGTTVSVGFPITRLIPEEDRSRPLRRRLYRQNVTVLDKSAQKLQKSL
ncbi:MAG: PAS domain-containing sensor histidine kinase [Cyanophyceae cyanobacterium]